MEALKLCIDIDGCVYPWTQAVNIAVERQFGIRDIGDHLHWDHLKDFLTEDQWHWVWSKHAAEKVFGQSLWYPHSREVINRLIKRGVEVHFVTHRNPRNTAEVTARYICESFPRYHGIHVIDNSIEKSSIVNGLNADAVIEDKPSVIDDLLWKTGAKVLVPVRPWNELARSSSLVLGFDHWREVPNHL